MQKSDLNEGDVVVLRQSTEGSFFLDSEHLESDELFVTALVTDLEAAFGIEVEFCEPVPSMSALGDNQPDHLDAPGSEFNFGDTTRWIEPSEIISHYSPKS